MEGENNRKGLASMPVWRAQGSSSAGAGQNGGSVPVYEEYPYPYVNEFENISNPDDELEASNNEPLNQTEHNAEERSSKTATSEPPEQATIQADDGAVTVAEAATVTAANVAITTAGDAATVTAANVAITTAGDAATFTETDAATVTAVDAAISTASDAAIAASAGAATVTAAAAASTTEADATTATAADTVASTDNPFETEHYKWDHAENKWIPKFSVEAETVAAATEQQSPYQIDENGDRTYTEQDGTVYIWEEDKKAWFPKITQDFLAHYQMNYGFPQTDCSTAAAAAATLAEEQAAAKEQQEKLRQEEELKRMTEEARNADAVSTGKRKADKEPPKWFEMAPEQNTKVYVSNLPLDITLDEFAELMGKCGMIMRDPITQKFKLKLYAEPCGQLKGDGLCDYIKLESVDLALNILDEYVLRGHKISVQRAKFQMRGEYNPALKPKRKKKDKEKLLKMKEKLFDWRPEKLRGERTKNEKTVIVKNLFTPEMFEKDVKAILEYQTDLLEECSKYGKVKKVVIYDRHVEGIAQINMSSPEEADMVIEMMHGRFFGKRQLRAEHWDGQTKYKVFESTTEEEQRLTNWDKFLEEDEEDDRADKPHTTGIKKPELEVVGATNSKSGSVSSDQVVETTDAIPENTLRPTEPNVQLELAAPTVATETETTSDSAPAAPPIQSEP